MFCEGVDRSDMFHFIGDARLYRGDADSVQAQEGEDRKNEGEDNTGSISIWGTVWRGLELSHIVDV